MKALIIGATGSTGKFLVDDLLLNKNYSEVAVFVRRPTGKKNPKLIEHIVDFSKLTLYKKLVMGDVVFSCLGTTLKAAGSKEKQREIDLDIPAAFAKIAKENDVKSHVLVSSTGASSQSSVFYSKLKGELEEKVTDLDFEQNIIFRPGPLAREGSDRLGEKIAVKLFGILNAVGLFKKYKPLPTSILAEKLAKAPKTLPSGKTTIELNKIFDL